MRKRQIFFLILLGLLLMGTMALSGGVIAQDAAEVTPTPTPPHWDYSEAEAWGELGEQYAVCDAGHAQSPIDITGATELNLSDIQFNYTSSAMNILNNGHTVQVNVDAGSSITYNGITYDLLQFHFHHPSEHTFNGVAAPMEVHFVHKDPNTGNLAVVGIMLVEGDASNADFAQIFSNLPAEKSDAVAMGSLTMTNLLPEDHSFTTYNGSLTTPPCSEIVRWLVLDAPMTLTAEEIAAFGAIFEMNARPVQDLNGRDLLGDNG